MQASVDSAAAAESLARCLLQPNAALTVATCFRPVLLQLVRCLLDKQNDLAETSAAAYYITLVQIIEVAPHLEWYVLFAHRAMWHSASVVPRVTVICALRNWLLQDRGPILQSNTHCSAAAVTTSQARTGNIAGQGCLAFLAASASLANMLELCTPLQHHSA